MKYLILISVFFLLFVGCDKTKQTKKNVNENNDFKTSYVITSDDNCYFTIYYKPNDSLFSSIDSILIKKENVNQTIDLAEKKIRLKTSLIESFPIYANEDYNFDGVNDILLYPHVVNYSVYGNDYRANFFIFNKTTNKYESRVELDNLSNLDVCKKNKYIISSYSGSLTKFYWLNDTLKAFEIVEEEELVDGNYKIKTVNIEKNETKEFKSKRSIISNFQCK